jgi:predicted PurR-regulated permease PerM
MRSMNLQLTPGRLLAAAIVALSFWIVHGLVQAVLAAGLIAIASWPLYAAYRSRLPSGVGKSGGAAIFTFAITAFVLAPMVFAVWALLGQTHMLLQGLAAADGTGLALPSWLAAMPIVGPWLAARRQQLVLPGAVPMPHADPGALLDWAQTLGQFTLRHVLIVAFTILLLGFFYQEGALLARELTGALRQAIGDRAQRYVAVVTRAVRASVNSMLAVGIFDTVAMALAYTLAGTPGAWAWAAITGALAAVPFLGYVAVAAMGLQMASMGVAAPVAQSMVLGIAVLLAGDKVVRPIVAGGGMRLHFVWVLMGCIGGFEMLGLAGLVIGPVMLSLARELWQQEPAPFSSDRRPSPPPADR